MRSAALRLAVRQLRWLVRREGSGSVWTESVQAWRMENGISDETCMADEAERRLKAAGHDVDRYEVSQALGIIKGALFVAILRGRSVELPRVGTLRVVLEKFPFGRMGKRRRRPPEKRLEIDTGQGGYWGRRHRRVYEGSLTWMKESDPDWSRREE